MTKNCLYCGMPMQSLRNTKKYCNDNCKQLAFYKRNGLQLSGLNIAKAGHNALETENTVTIQADSNDIEVSSVKTAGLTLNDKESFTVNDTLTVKPPPQEEVYQWVQSGMVNLIAEYVDNSDELLLFQCPDQYWRSFILEGVKWVSLRLRCLLESLIRLSNYTHIQHDDLVAVRDAFDEPVASWHFRYLPNNYPYTALVKELQEKLTLLAKQHKHTKKFLFRLTVNRKAALIAKRYILAGFVPAIQFSELDFKE